MFRVAGVSKRVFMGLVNILKTLRIRFCNDTVSIKLEMYMNSVVKAERRALKRTIKSNLRSATT